MNTKSDNNWQPTPTCVTIKLSLSRRYDRETTILRLSHAIKLIVWEFILNNADRHTLNVGVLIQRADV